MRTLTRAATVAAAAALMAGATALPARADIELEIVQCTGTFDDPGVLEPGHHTGYASIDCDGTSWGLPTATVQYPFASATATYTIDVDPVVPGAYETGGTMTFTGNSGTVWTLYFIDYGWAPAIQLAQWPGTDYLFPSGRGYDDGWMLWLREGQIVDRVDQCVPGIDRESGCPVRQTRFRFTAEYLHDLPFAP